tara:strand:+ start:1699 stop:2817 length:1119 start_codon:yes stop_codon:yes gene_type:complete
MRIIHIITGLHIGGAERMLEKLLIQEIDSKNTLIISLSSIGEIGANLEKLGYDLVAIDLKKNLFSLIKGFFKIRRYIRAFKPNIVQTWLYHSNLIGSLASLFLNINVVWNLRGTSIPQGFFSMTNFVIIVLSFLSYFMPKKIICCGASVKEAHRKMGFSDKKMIVIPNGYDFKNFKKNDAAGLKIRQKYNVKESDILIGSVGRFDPLKDHDNFIQACAMIRKHNKDIEFIIIGRDINSKNNALMSILIKHNMDDDIILIDEQKSLNSFYSAMDIFCLHSLSEGFPNVLVEAMANSLPCVSTDAGEAEIILNNSEYTVRVNNPIDLSKKLLSVAELSVEKRKQLGFNNSSRVKNKYDIRKIKKIYFDLYKQLS